jgi:hypothetical protein
LGVAGVKQTEGGKETGKAKESGKAKETGEAEVLVGAIQQIEAVGVWGAGEALKVRDAVEAGDSVRVRKVVRGNVAGASQSNIVKASAAAILAEIQQISLPHLNLRRSRGLRAS